MFIIGFQGGLGKQMFQYAFFRAMKYYHPNSIIKADLTKYEIEKTHQGYELENIFGIKLCRANHKEVMKYSSYILPWKYFPILYKIKREILGTKCKIKKDSHLIDDYKIAFNDTYFQLNDKSDYYLDGYWQDERYFYCVRKKIMDEFSFNKNIYLKNKEVINQLASENSIGVHIRRGDYVNTGFDITRIDYYRKAIEFISNKTKKPIFYFFSDDVGYVKKKFDFISSKKIITGNTGANSYIDMFLMSKCKHNIIANSSFSYWGAYLNKNINKIVVAPRYFSTEIKRPLACENWVIL